MNKTKFYAAQCYAAPRIKLIPMCLGGDILQGSVTTNESFDDIRTPISFDD